MTQLTRRPLPGGQTSTAVVVEIRGLRCCYGRYEAVRGIDLEVRRGEVFALLGTNGAGKTTTLEVLSGFRWLIAAFQNTQMGADTDIPR